MINIKNLSFAYQKESPIFLDFNWEIAPGERWSIIGPSGCGKTTLLYLLAGLRIPDNGKIIMSNGHSNNSNNLTGLVLQDFGLLPWATALENVSLGLKIHGVERKKISEISRKWMLELGIESISDHYPGELSGGQRQRVAIARTLALEPALLLMDEPFASLDTLTRENLLDLTLSLWNNLKFTMVLVTHNIEEAVFWGNRILVLGKSPNSSPIVIKNAGSGSPDFRRSSEFNTVSRNLRGVIEQKGLKEKT